jgi:hypothetical protein
MINSRSTPYIYKHKKIILKGANKYNNGAHKRLPKFSQLLGNSITPTCV